MKRCLQEIVNAIASGEPAALVTIVEKRGSMPRGVGTAMVVRLDGSQEGTIGGGSMEARVRNDALALLKLRESAVRNYTIDAGNPTDQNSVSVLIRIFSGGRDRKMIHRALNEMVREKGYLVCTIEQDSIGETEYVSEQETNENPALVSWLEKAPVLTAELHPPMGGRAGYRAARLRVGRRSCCAGVGACVGAAAPARLGH